MQITEHLKSTTFFLNVILLWTLPVVEYPTPVLVVFQGVVRIHLLEAQNLAAKDSYVKGVMAGLSDPYAILRVGPQTFTSKHMDNTDSPKWEEMYEVWRRGQGCRCWKIRSRLRGLSVRVLVMVVFIHCGIRTQLSSTQSLCQSSCPCVCPLHQVIVHEVPGQELEVEIYDKDPDQDDFLGRYISIVHTSRVHTLSLFIFHISLLSNKCTPFLSIYTLIVMPFSFCAGIFFIFRQYSFWFILHSSSI